MANQTALKQQLQSYIETRNSHTESLVMEEFPKTIFHINELLEAPPFRAQDSMSVPDFLELEPEVLAGLPTTEAEETACVVAAAPAAVEPIGDQANVDTSYLPHLSSAVPPLVEERIKLVKPLISKLVEEARLVEIWITLLMPKVEDGNNFGVQVQSQTLGFCHNIVSAASMYKGNILKYIVERAMLCAKMSKHATAKDYRRAVLELDRHKYNELHVVLRKVRDNYLILHDIVAKNLEKIKAPRTSSFETLY